MCRLYKWYRLIMFSFQVATQFKSSLAGLAEILMSKEPWYIRCLKPNHCKQPGKPFTSHLGLVVLSAECFTRASDLFLTHLLSGLFDDVMVRHQVKYLGLMEHLRVRRAGFAYRRRYEVFLKRCVPQNAKVMGLTRENTYK